MAVPGSSLSSNCALSGASAKCSVLYLTVRLYQADVLISIDGRGRAPGPILGERLWRTIKHKDVYIND